MRNDAGIARFVPSRDDAPVIGFVGLLFAEDLLFGANRWDLSLIFALVQLALLILVLLMRKGRSALGPALAALPFWSFILVLAGAVFSLIPIGAQVGHPLWTYVAPEGGSISLDPLATRLEIVKLLGLAAVFLLASTIGFRRERAETFILSISYLGALYAVWAFLAWTTNPHVIFGVVRPYGGERLSGSFLTANSAGTLFACLTVLQVCVILRVVRRLPRPVWSRRSLSELQGALAPLVLLLLFSACLLLTASRGGAIACAAAVALTLACFSLLRTNSRSASGGVAAVGALVVFAALALLLISGNPVLQRFGGGNPLTDSRLNIFAEYWRSFMASPWWGYGLGAFRSINFQSMTSKTAVVMGNLGAAHNVYLQWLLQTGLWGFVPMMVCMGAIVLTIVRGFKRRASQQALLVFSLAATAVFAVHGAVDFALEEPSLAAFFAAVLGLGYGIATRP